MKKQEFVQIKGLDIKELGIKVKALRQEIANLSLDKNMKKLKDLKMVSKKKKELAQILTVIKQKEQLSVLSGQLSDIGKSVISQPVTEEQTTDKPTSVSPKENVLNRKTGGKK